MRTLHTPEPLKRPVPEVEAFDCILMAKNKKKGGKKSNQGGSIPNSARNEVPNSHVEKETELQPGADQVTSKGEQLSGDGMEKIPVENYGELSKDPKLHDLQDEVARLKNELEEEQKANKHLQEVQSNGEGSNLQDLQGEVARLKKELEEEQRANKQLQETQLTEEENGNSTSNEELEKVKSERDELETQYNNLLSRISSMKTFFNKMKESQEELNIVKEQLGEYESQNIRLKTKVEIFNKERNELENTVATLNREFSDLDHEHTKLQTMCDQYRQEVSSLNSKLENFSNDMSEELDSSREENNQLKSQIEELAIMLDNNKQDIALLKQEKADLISNLENSLKEKAVLQDTLKEIESDLDERTTTFQGELQEKNLEIKSLRAQLDSELDSSKEASKAIEELKEQVESMKEDVSLKEKYEKESKERVLQIGKLRHEAIILNEHLTKALTMLKQSSDSESVDKELISNLLISFVAIPRADPRKFEVLELISSFLSWDDDKKRQAGLIYNKEPGSNPSGSRTENFVSMWTDFLEKESENI